MAEERRKQYPFGITPGEWVMIIGICIGGLSTYFTVAQSASNGDERSQKNEKSIGQLQDKFLHEIKQSEQRTLDAMQRSEQRTREDIRELRELILRRAQP